MDSPDTDRNGLEAGTADDCKGAVGLQLAFLVKHSNQGTHAIIRCDYLLKDLAFVCHFIDFVLRFLDVLFT